MPRNAALRILEALVDAAKGNYYRQGWDMYVDRRDVEACALAAVDPIEATTYRKMLKEALNA